MFIMTLFCRRIVAHAHWTVEKRKMSKVNPFWFGMRLFQTL